MKLQKKKISLASGYKIFALLSSMIVLFILGKQLYDKLHFIKSNQKLFYSMEANKAQLAINDSLSYVESFSMFVADKIANLEVLSPETISSLLNYKAKNYTYPSNILTTPIMYFITAEGDVILSTPLLSDKKDNSNSTDKGSSNCVMNAPITPWKLCLDKMSIGDVGGSYFIPTSLGVTSYKNDKFLGVVSGGVDVNKLNKKIKEYLEGIDTEYLILNAHFEPLVFSENIMNIINTEHSKYLIKNLQNIEGELKQDVIMNDVHFRYYKKDPNFSYIILVGISRNAEFRIIANSILEHFNISLVILIGFSVILYFFNKVMLTPLKLLSQNALAIAAGKKILYTPNLNTEDSQYLAQALNMVQNSLKREKHIQEELMQTNTTLEERVKKRTEELEESLGSNIEFVNHMSHEVRNPVHGINALARGLVDNWDKLDKVTAFNLATKIASNSQRLLSLVNNILDIAKMSYGEMHFQLQKISINKLIEEMIEECKNLYIYDKDIQLSLEAECEIEVLIDADKITQVLRNLLSNAIKVTKHGKITVLLKKKQNFAVISISDEGMGIPEQELETIFESFSQSTRTKGKISGTGLGLTISKKIIEGHGGQIWAQNNSPERGASFVFTLSLSSNFPSTTKYSICTSALQFASTTSKVNLMIIDDEETCLLSASMITYNTNYKIFTYLSAVEALSYLQDNPNKIDIILVDIMMPEMTGIEFLDTIKSNPKLQHIPIIIQSGASDEFKFKEAFRKGAVDLINKPYNAEILINSVEKALQDNKKKN